MIARHFALQFVMLIALGTWSASAQTNTVQHITVSITSTVQHLGHSINRSQIGTISHDSWFGGIKGSITSNNEPLLIWWCNLDLSESRHSFQQAGVYKIEYQGVLDDCPLAYTGNCLRVTKILSLTREDK